MKTRTNIVIYIWKMVQGIVPMTEDLHREKLEALLSFRRGRLLKVPQLKRVNPKLCYRLEASFMTRAPRLFHCLPLELKRRTVYIEQL